MKKMVRGCLAALTLAASMGVGNTFPAFAAQDMPFEVILDRNSRKTSIYDGYSRYVDGNRASEEDTFHVVANGDVDLSDVVMDYRVLTFDEEGTQVTQECTVYGIEEDVHYPVLRPETVERESEKGMLYDELNRCYTIEFSSGDQVQTYYFMAVPEDEMEQYRNVILGKWEKNTQGTRYKYQGDYLKGWNLINEKWYLFGDDGYMKKGWQEYQDEWYFLDRESGQMRTDCTVEGYQLDSSGVRE